MRRAKLSPEAAAAAARDVDAEEARRCLVEASVSAVTLRIYHSRTGHMREFMKHAGLQYFTLEDFTRYCAVMAPHYVSLEGHRSALLVAQRSERFGLRPGEEPWAGSSSAITLVKGADYNGREAKPDASRFVRGAITPEMVAELAELALARGWPQLRSAVTIAGGAALRPNELVGCRIEHWDSPGSRVYIARDKRYNARSMHQRSGDEREGYWKPVFSLAARVELDIVCAGRRPDELIFPYGRLADGRFNLEDFRTFVGEGARELGWSPELKWVPHSFRHGGVGDIIGTLHEQNRLGEASRILQMSVGTIPTYAETNESRLKRARESGLGSPSLKKASGVRTLDAWLTPRKL